MMIFDFIPNTAEQWLTTAAFFAILILLLVIAELFNRFLHLSQEFSRKFIHISVGILVVIFSLQIETYQPVIFLCLIFILSNIFIIKYNLIPSMSSNRKSYGTVYYPIVIAVSLLIFWDTYKFIFINIVLILAISDALAAIVGQSVKSPLQYKVWSDKKSLQGSIAMFLTTTAIIFFVDSFFSELIVNNNKYPILLIAIASSITITLAESISAKGSDNLSIGVFAGFILYVFYYGSYLVQTQFIYAIIFSFVFILLSFHFKFLKLDGAIAAGLMAIIIFGIGGWIWTIPILTFFLPASILSKVGMQKKIESRLQFEKSSNRDAKQVVANGIIPLLFCVFYFFNVNDLIVLMYICALAAASADTWATEIGVLTKNFPRMITTLKIAPKGASGAVSILGTFAAFLGSTIIAISGFILFNFSLENTLTLTIFGFLGSFIDSLLGATVQAQYYDNEKQKLTEKLYDNFKNRNKLVRGYVWFNNDVVNLSAIIITTLFFSITYMIMM